MDARSTPTVTPSEPNIVIEEITEEGDDGIQIHQGIEVDCARLPPDIPFGDREIHRDDFGDWDEDNPATSHGYHSRAEWEKSCRAAEWCAQHPVSDGRDGCRREVGPDVAAEADRDRCMGAGGDRLGAKERLIARKQRNKMSTSRHNWYKANQRVHTQHYLVQYDNEIASPGEGSNERDAEMDLSQQRLLLLQLALLTTVTAELEDLRSDEDRAADHLMFGPHDHASGPASMEREVRADEYSCAGNALRTCADEKSST